MNGADICQVPENERCTTGAFDKGEEEERAPGKTTPGPTDVKTDWLPRINNVSMEAAPSGLHSAPALRTNGSRSGHQTPAETRGGLSRAQLRSRNALSAPIDMTARERGPLLSGHRQISGRPSIERNSFPSLRVFLYVGLCLFALVIARREEGPSARLHLSGATNNL